ncbi:UNVERIFIED_CONTAM: Low-density lipoprotein receptor-related protein 1 [Trichonephila clavipes]
MFVIVLGFMLVLSPLFSTSNGTPCTGNEFPCNDGNCIDLMLWCDSNKDCSDESDEAYCRKNTFFDKNPNRCSDKFFKCHDGRCIPLSGRCDGPNKYSESTSVSSKNQTPLTKADRFHSDIGVDSHRAFDSEIDYHIGDVENDFLGLHLSEFSLQREKARKWIISQRLENFGWGSETPRALAALYLSDVHSSKRTETDMLMVKQLEVQLSLDIARNGTSAMALTDLALYINALLVSCRDPRNFYGNDLVGTLRYRVNSDRTAGKFVNPAVYLTLCLNNDTTYEDARSLHEIFHSKNVAHSRTDIQALSMLMATCAFHSNKSLSAESYDGYKRQFLNKLKSKNCTGNIYEAALVMQY